MFVTNTMRNQKHLANTMRRVRRVPLLSIATTRNLSTSTKKPPRVAVIGAGVAGIQTVDQLRQIGFSCTIFDQNPDVGGVWRENYAEFGLQVPYELYEFPGFPFAENEKVDKFPRGPEVQTYIKRFAEERKVYTDAKFNTKVTGINRCDSTGGWAVSYRGIKDENTNESTDNFDYCVMATGMYSRPNVPKFPGQETFQGEVMHASSFKDGQTAGGKKVVVVGGGKSAIDCAFVASKHGKSSTLLFRHAHWPVPQYLLDLVPFKWGTYSRFGHFMLARHHDVGALNSIGHTIAAPFKYAWWRIVETMFKFQFGLSGDRVPTTNIDIDVFSGGQILNYDYRDALKKGSVSDRLGSIARYTPSGVELEDGTQLETDLVVFGTGFAKDYSLFDKDTTVKLDRERDGLYLYRSVIPADVPGLAFVGAEVSTFNNILTQALQTRWLKQAWGGDLKLPAPDIMKAEVETEKAWKRSWMPTTGSRAAIFQLHKMKYHDRLCKDMGVAHRRKGGNLLAEAFAPYTADDYKGLFPRVGAL